MPTRPNHHRSGFTLIELLVQISIIALLIGMLMPTIAKVDQIATKTVCASNLRQIGLGIQAYQDAHANKFPEARYMPDPFISLFPDDPGLPQTLKHEMPAKSQVYRCRGDDGYIFDRTGISYTFNASLAGRQIDETWFARRVKFHITEIPVAYDCDGNTFLLKEGEQITVPPFHLRRNLLFADGHVGNYVAD